MRQSFQVIFLLYALVVPLVTGLFFLIVTLQKSGALTLLRAIGARPVHGARSLLVQVLVLAARPRARHRPVRRVAGGRIGSFALRYRRGAVVLWAVLLLVLGLIGALVSLRRVLRIDPVEATTGGGAR